MTTDPINHRAEAEKWLSKAAGPVDSEWDVSIAEVEALVGIGHWLGALHDLLAELRDDDPEPRHRRELDEDDPDTLPGDDDSCPHDARRENPDGSSTCIRCDAWSRYGWRETDDTIEQPRFGLAYIDDNRLGYEPVAPLGHPDSYPRAEPADRVRLSGFAAIHRHDDFGPPWGAA